MTMSQRMQKDKDEIFASFAEPVATGDWKKVDKLIEEEINRGSMIRLMAVKACTKDVQEHLTMFNYLQCSEPIMRARGIAQSITRQHHMNKEGHGG